MLNPTEILEEKNVILDLEAKDREGVCSEIVSYLVSQHPTLKSDPILRLLLEREKASSTAVENGVAFPHVRVSNLPGLLVVIARSRVGVDFGSLDKKPTHIFVVLLASEAPQYLRMLAKLSKALQKSTCRECIMAAQNAHEIIKVLSN